MGYEAMVDMSLRTRDDIVAVAVVVVANVLVLMLIVGAWSSCVHPTIQRWVMVLKK